MGKIIEVSVESGMTLVVNGGHYIKNSVRITEEVDAFSTETTQIIIDRIQADIEEALIHNLTIMATDTLPEAIDGTKS